MTRCFARDVIKTGSDRGVGWQRGYAGAFPPSGGFIRAEALTSGCNYTLAPRRSRHRHSCGSAQLAFASCFGSLAGIFSTTAARHRGGSRRLTGTVPSLNCKEFLAGHVPVLIPKPSRVFWSRDPHLVTVLRQQSRRGWFKAWLSPSGPGRRENPKPFGAGTMDVLGKQIGC